MVADRARCPVWQLEHAPSWWVDRILLACQNQHLVTELLAQRERMGPRVDLAAALGERRKPVNNHKDPHYTNPARNGFQPRTADKAPRYWPSGQATASAAPLAACAGSMRI